MTEGVHVVVVILSTITVSGLTEEWFILLLLYCLPLLFKVWQRSGSRCFGWLYCLQLLILGLIEEWFMLFLLYILPLLLKVWQRSGPCCGCYIVYHYSLIFWQRSGSCFSWLYCLPLLFKVLRRYGSYCYGRCYCLTFGRLEDCLSLY